jgi:hypothetical protein
MDTSERRWRMNRIAGRPDVIRPVRSSVSIRVHLWLLLYASISAGADLTMAQTEFFESKIRPVLASACYDCHGPEKQKAGLRLDWRDGLLKGGDSGPAIVPGKADESLLLHAIAHTHAELKMPKNADALSKATVDDFRIWIEMGAPDPRDKPSADNEGDWPAAFALRRQWWCWQPLKNAEPPDIPGVEHPVDRFLQAEMQIHGLTPAPPADSATIARRLAFILTGLPPESETAAAPDQILNLKSQISNHLASPRFGERWARHWMDWLRYADSHGSEGDPAIPHAWQYRDYLIRALNADVPYPQLVKEHIAGDLIAPRLSADATLNESAIGPAHLRMVFHGFTPTDALDEFVTFTDNQVDVVSKAFLGLTVSCARCHNHKFDAISQEDYYALFGIFANCRPATIDVRAPKTDSATRGRMAELKKEITAAVLKDWNQSLRTLPQRLAAWQPKDDAERKEADAGGHGPLAAWLAVRDAASGQIEEKWFEACDKGIAHLQALRDWKVSADKSGRARWNGQEGNLTWSGSGAGAAAPVEAVEVSITASGERLTDGLLPQGFVSSRYAAADRAVLTSGPFPAEGGRLWVRAGGRSAGLRYAVHHYPRSGLIYPKSTLDSDDARWFEFNLDYWIGETIHLEAWTSADAPIETGGTGGHFSVLEVAYPQDARLTPPPAGIPLSLYAPEEPAAKSREEVLARYAQAISTALANRKGVHHRAEFINFFVRAGLLPAKAADLPAAAPLVEEYRRLEKTLHAPIRVPGVMEGGPGDWPLYARGDHKKPGALVPRRFLSALDATAYQTKESGRRELAASITGPGYDLASRVIVNRLWHHVFGRGIVATTDNFGKLGELPTHPELLDWLAREFQKSGGSIKAMLRLLVTSQAFQAQAAPSPEAAAKDPENKLLSHWTLRRMEAESIRDSILAVSGKLDLTAGGPGVDGTAPRRSVYVRVIRNALDSFLTVFDAPVPSSTRGRRDATNVPAQALTLMNSPLVQSWAGTWADRVINTASDKDARIRQFYRDAFQRDPSPDEIAQCALFLEQTEKTTRFARVERDLVETKLAVSQLDVDTLTAPVVAKLKSAAPPAVPGVKPFAEWDFENPDPARAGTLPLQLHGSARIAGGALHLDGQNSYAATPPLQTPMRAKTLEIWVSLTTLDQSGGGIITVQDLDGNLFDAIVFAEKDPRQWLAGSNVFSRTQTVNGPQESEATQRPVHVAITWAADGTIRIYRDGQLYGQPYQSTGPVAFDSGKCQVLLGLRHGDPTGNRLLSGSIHRARIYDRTLTPDEIALTASLEGAAITRQAILAELPEESRARYAALTDDIAALQSRLTDLSAAAPVDPWQSLALAFINMKEFISLR